MTPRVSVVVPAYNSADFVAATVDSILAQTFQDFELVISDHSSTDGSWELLQPYADDPRVRLTRLPAGGGAVANWNAVTEAATGEYLKLVCSDDVIYPRCLAAQLAALDAHPTAAMTACTRDIIDAQGNPVLRKRGLPGLSGLVDGRRAIRKSVLAGTNIFGEPVTVMFRRAALTAAGNWDGRYRFLIDQASYGRVLLDGDLVAIPEPLAGFRISESQWSVQLARSQAEEARAYHRALAADHPGLLSSPDLTLGNLRASVNAIGRRVVYLGLRRRMRAAQTQPSAEDPPAEHPSRV